MDSLMRENEDSYKRFRLEVESIAKSKEKEMAELKDAYKEKHRKCQAWEKVTKCLNRQQLTCLRFHLIGTIHHITGIQ